MLERVVQDQHLAFLPVAAFATSNHDAALGHNKAEMQAQAVVGRAAVRAQVCAGCVG